MFEIFIALLFLRYENCFVVTGLVLPNHCEDRAVCQMQLLDTVKSFLAKLSPTLSEHEIKYIRVVKGPAPSILEVECAEIKGYAELLYDFSFLTTLKKFR
jgi:hypothetical protein